MPDTKGHSVLDEIEDYSLRLLSAQDIFGNETRIFEFAVSLACQHDGRMYVWDDDSESWYLVALSVMSTDTGPTFPIMMGKVPVCSLQDIPEAIRSMVEDNFAPAAAYLEGYISYLKSPEA